MEEASLPLQVLEKQLHFVNIFGQVCCLTRRRRWVCGILSHFSSWCTSKIIFLANDFSQYLHFSDDKGMVDAIGCIYNLKFGKKIKEWNYLPLGAIIAVDFRNPLLSMLRPGNKASLEEEAAGTWCVWWFEIVATDIFFGTGRFDSRGAWLFACPMRLV